MPDNGIQENTRFVGRKKKEKPGVKKVLQPRLAIINSFTLIAVVYCISSSILFFSVVGNYFLSAVHLLALLSVVTNYFVLLRTKNFKRATNVILTTGTVVVVSLFTTGGWENTGYLWPFAYLPYAFFLTERHTVMHWVVALFSGCILAVLLHIAGAITIPYSPVAIANFFAALLVFTMCILLFQKATVKREEFLSYTGALLEAAPDAVIVINDQGQILKWNDKAEILFGWKEHEVAGRLLSSVIIPLRYREAQKKGLKRFLETGEGPVLNKTIEIKGLNKSNKELDVALSISPVIVKEKYQFIGFVRDITEQKKAEEKVKESEHMFSTLFHSSPVLNAISEASTGKYIEVNDAFARFFDFTKEEMLGKSSIELNILSRPEERELIIKKIQQDGFVRDAETQTISKNGKTRWVSTNIDIINLNGKDCFLTAAIDITARKEAEEEIRKMNMELERRVEEKQTLYCSIAHSSDDAIFSRTLDGIITSWNHGAEKSFGYSAKEITGKHISILIPPQLMNEENEIMDKIRKGEGVDHYETERIRKDGKIIYVSLTISPLRDSLGNITGASKISRDITERKIAEEEKIKYTHDLERSNKELEQFAYIVSHDLQKPLRMVGSYVQLLEKRYKGKLDADADEFIHFAIDGANRIKQLISDLLNYSRTSRETQITEVDIAKVLGDVKKNLTTSIIESNAKINHNGMPVIKADRTQMMQLFQNLIANAIKFRKEDEAPVINVKAINENGHWYLSVSDNGIGIEKEYSDKIFVIFKRLNDKAKYGGTGIGLAIAKKIVERHRGKIWFESELGKGTTFFFTLKNLQS